MPLPGTFPSTQSGGEHHPPHRSREEELALHRFRARRQTGRSDSEFAGHRQTQRPRSCGMATRNARGSADLPQQSDRFVAAASCGTSTPGLFVSVAGRAERLRLSVMACGNRQRWRQASHNPWHMQPFPAPDTAPIKWPVMRANRTKMPNIGAVENPGAPSPMIFLDPEQFSRRFVPVHAFGWIPFPVARAHSWLADSATVRRDVAEYPTR